MIIVMMVARGGSDNCVGDDNDYDSNDNENLSNNNCCNINAADD